MADTKMRLEDWLDDLCVRFIINLPQEDLSSVARICFQVEEAQWFYEDFIRPLDPTLPSMSLRSFCLRIFQHCPLLAPFSVENHMRAFEEFLQYKTRVPVRGAILLNEAMDSTVLVKGWKKGANWSFPRGKINKDEDDLDCAIREVYEEIGFDLREAGLVPNNEGVKYIEMTMREQHMRLYVFRDIPVDTHFEPKTRKEISKIQWYKLSELPAFRKKGNNQQNEYAAAANANKFYMVAPFLVPLKKWVLQQKKKDGQRASTIHLGSQPLQEEFLTEDDIGTHAEPAVYHSRITPAIDTLEGATQELQRLLKIQPPTQGLQTSIRQSPNHDKGGELLAILQSKEQARQPSQQYPHTPLDAIQNSAPEPPTPQHHHPSQQAPLSSYQNPPPFPVPPNTSSNPSMQYYAQENASAMQNMNNNTRQQPQVPRPLAPPHQQPIPLLHPQPLPPQVQSSLRTFSSPGIPESGPNGTTANLAAQLGGLKPMIPPAKQPLPQLNSHSMALLNAFKADAREIKGSPTAAQNQRPTHISQQDGNAWPTSQPYASAQTAIAPASARAPQPIPGSGARYGSYSGLRQSPGPGRQGHVSLPPSTAEGMRGSTGPGPVPYQADYPPNRQNLMHPVSGVGAVQAVSQAAGAVGGTVRMNHDVNLPFGALSTLGRSKEREAQLSPPTNQVSRNPVVSQPFQGQAGGEAYHMTRPHNHLHPSPHGVSAQSMIRPRPPPAQQPAQHATLPCGAQAYNVGPNPAVAAASLPNGTGGFQRRQGANSEDKQKLLSLFKPQPSPTRGMPPVTAPASAGSKVSGQSPIMFGYIPANTGERRSRVASLASAGSEAGVSAIVSGGGGAGSRRGSQTPISPADRSFLLDYLQSQSVSNSAGH